MIQLQINGREFFRSIKATKKIQKFKRSNKFNIVSFGTNFD
jgi:hypothetical protein